MKEYWEDAVTESLEAAGINATRTQIEEIASDMRISSDCTGQYTGAEFIPNPEETENERLRLEIKLQAEKNERFLFQMQKNYASINGFDVADVHIDSDGRFLVR